jgi:SAM-dependent methyltransferase
LVERIEQLFREHGDTHKGLGYPKPDGFEDRYRVFLDVARFDPRPLDRFSVLDIGCATGCVLDELEAQGRKDVGYRGVDLSPAMVQAAQAKHPGAEFILGDPFDLPQVWDDPPDYVIMGGIFTWRPGISREEMSRYMLDLLRLAFTHCCRGVCFNVMSHHVDWRRDDLFHVPFDEMAALVREHLSRNYIFRADYGLFEYTTYVYK